MHNNCNTKYKHLTIRFKKINRKMEKKQIILVSICFFMSLSNNIVI